MMISVKHSGLHLCIDFAIAFFSSFAAKVILQSNQKNMDVLCGSSGLVSPCNVMKCIRVVCLIRIFQKPETGVY